MDNLIVKSFAKINIGLNIISKREDGFHNLETIFYPLRLYDEISIKKSNKFLFNSNNKELNKVKSNLIIKAKEELEKYFKIELPVEIYLDKTIPIGSGLGGGSSNAASTIKALIKLFNLEILPSTLLDITLRIGSDVPYFLNPVAAFAESRGEIIKSINLKLNKYLLIVNPGIHISTKWAFSLITPQSPIISIKSLVEKTEVEKDNLMGTAKNDFETVVFNHFPKIKEIKDKMIEFGASYSMMTGTGSTVWGIFEDMEPAYQSELYFKCKNYFTYIESPT
jgi:4-diphosphocytidyl-2-C-methyl-D-erythritol kinase